MIWRRKEGEKKLRACYDKLVHEHLSSVHRAAHRLTGNAADAEDLAQEVFLKAWRSIEKVCEMEAARPWLFRVMRNAWLDRVRKSGRRPQLVAMEESPDPEAPEPIARLSELEDQQVLHEHIDSQVVEALDELPDGERLVLLYHAFGDLNYREIAEAMDCPVGTVMSRLHRARARLRTKLVDYAIRHRLIAEKEDQNEAEA